ncbi:hypothetical protein IEQ34_017648 [Dendrobium chrysotoxum]|uniref:Uncharacterized protein n=1 Tax=Dendrobium chrysotoxum TaxID=161865 RepID=A0AAV7GBW5_DENCH|nr:hypothetical protein IEQ34_017648 [Dendrobium chrysotoxum]
MDITKKHPKKIWLSFEKYVHGHSINECFIVHPHLKKTNKCFNNMVKMNIENKRIKEFIFSFRKMWTMLIIRLFRMK